VQRGFTRSNTKPDNKALHCDAVNRACERKRLENEMKLLGIILVISGCFLMIFALESPGSNIYRNSYTKYYTERVKEFYKDYPKNSESEIEVAKMNERLLGTLAVYADKIQSKNKTKTLTMYIHCL